MKHDERLVFLAEGLPIILESAHGLWAASQQLSTMPREADVLRNHAEEEAAKVLIVMDMVRCPKKLCASKIGVMVNWFYDHLASTDICERHFLEADACRTTPGIRR